MMSYTSRSGANVSIPLDWEMVMTECRKDTKFTTDENEIAELIQKIREHKQAIGKLRQAITVRRRRRVRFQITVKRKLLAKLSKQLLIEMKTAEKRKLMDEERNVAAGNMDTPEPGA